MPNRLARELSPYLLQHAENPVDWYPWGDEAFARARAEGKPIFLSIGYSTCHWCHVMERESFEDPKIAAFLAANFVAVKVDREERPDVDRVYMTFVQATTGSGGWPMSVWLTPDLEPFFGGTYFPPRDAYGRPSFLTVLEGIAKAWAEQRDEIVASGQSVLARMREINRDDPPGALPGVAALEGAAAVLGKLYDGRFAGFGNAPKFPRPANFSFLLREARRQGAQDLSQMARRTLLMMGKGGMTDQLGGGFHRYSVDREWHVPHFEKMLYDQAQLLETLAEAVAERGGPLEGDRAELAQLARDTVAYVARDLTDASGGFHCGEDADSPVAPGAHERKEGAFYVWTEAELSAVCGADAEIVRHHYGVLAAGNADDPHGELTGKNVLHAREHGVAETARAVGQSEAVVAAALARGRAALLAVRSTRPRPHLDDKVLGAWNGLMIRALAVAAGHLDEPAWLELATRAADGVLAALWRPETATLSRRLRQGQVGERGQLDDHAALARACLALYEATFERRFIAHAEALVAAMNARFADDEGGGWYAAPGDDPSLKLRLKEDYDGAEPSGTSLALLASLELAEHTGDARHTARAERALAGLASRLGGQPHAMPLALVAVDWLVAGPTHVVIAGELGDPRTAALAAVARAAFIPRRVLLHVDDAGRAQLAARLPWAAAMGPVGGAPAAYVCRDRACERPITDPAALARALSSRA